MESRYDSASDLSGSPEGDNVTSNGKTEANLSLNPCSGERSEAIDRTRKILRNGRRLAAAS